MSIQKSKPIQWLVLLALLATLLAVASKNMVVDLDLFHEMSLYRQMETEGSMPRLDDFAYTPTNNPVVHHEWATGAIIYLVCVTLGAGAPGLVILKYLLTFGVGVGCYIYARRNGASLAVFALLAIVALNVGGWMAFTNIRAQLFTLFFLVVMLLLLDTDRRGGRWWIAIWLPLVVVWGNVHGGVVSGIGLIGCYGIARTIESWLETRSLVGMLQRVWHLGVTGVATAGLLNVSPYGWDYVPYLIRAIRMPRKLIPEWNPIWQLDSYDALLFFAVSIVIAGFALAIHWRQSCRLESGTLIDDGAGEGDDSRPIWQRDLFTPLALLLTAYMAAKHYRHGSLYAVTWLCLVPPLFRGVHQSVESIWNKRAQLINVVSIAIIVVALGLSIRSQFWQLRVPGKKAFAEEAILVYPVGPVDYLAEHKFEGKLFVPFNLGAYVSWKLYPWVRVSIDSRYEVAYPPGALEENFAFYNKLGDWKSVLDKYPPDAILIPKFFEFDDEVRLLSSGEGEWKLCYEDREFYLLIKKSKADGLVYRDRSNERIEGVFP